MSGNETTSDDGTCTIPIFDNHKLILDYSSGLTSLTTISSDNMTSSQLSINKNYFKEERDVII